MSLLRTAFVASLGLLLLSCNPPSNSKRTQNKKETRADQGAEAAARKLEALRSLGQRPKEEPEQKVGLPPSLKKSLGVRTFAVPKEVLESKQDYQIALIEGEEVMARAIDSTGPREYLTIASGSSSTLEYSFHNDNDERTGAFEFVEREINWQFHHPDPKKEEGMVVLATGKAGDAELRLVLQPVPAD